VYISPPSLRFVLTSYTVPSRIIFSAFKRTALFPALFFFLFEPKTSIKILEISFWDISPSSPKSAERFLLGSGLPSKSNKK
jgi:hypothetical protein